MKKIILINSHLHSGSDILYESMARNQFVQGCKRFGGPRQYLSNIDLIRTSRIKHKNKSKKSYYLDEILFNYALSTKIDYSKFIIINFLRRPKETLEFLIHFNKRKPLFALRYYQYRLNRIYQTSKKTKCIFMCFESLDEEKIKKLKNFLEVEKDIVLRSEMFKYYNRDFNKEIVPKEILKSADECYEKYYGLLKRSCVYF